jgi:hypothetical protein
MTGVCQGDYISLTATNGPPVEKHELHGALCLASLMLSSGQPGAHEESPGRRETEGENE